MHMLLNVIGQVTVAVVALDLGVRRAWLGGWLINDRTHNGHVVLLWSHLSTHSWWKGWLQGSNRILSPSCGNDLRQLNGLQAAHLKFAEADGAISDVYRH